MIWFAVLGGIGAWLVHLIGGASLVSLSCQHHAVLWSIHALTAITVLVTLYAMRLSWGLQRADDEPRQFLGGLGLLIGAISLVLILLEGSFVLFLHPCA